MIGKFNSNNDVVPVDSLRVDNVHKAVLSKQRKFPESVYLCPLKETTNGEVLCCWIH